MKRMTFLFLMVIQFNMLAQENVTTFGIQFKPMLPLKFIGGEEEILREESFEATLSPQFGMNFGMVVRKGITKMWSFETGINLVQRNYSLNITHPDMPEDKSMNYRFICYEIPLQAMAYVKLGDQLYMNASGGFSFDMYPSNVESFASSRKDTTVFDYYQKTVRNGWLQYALLANYGFEWRTKKNGYYYFGVSYHRPFRLIGVTFLEAEKNDDPARLNFSLKGDYLTLDLRYFFHEKPDRKPAKQ